jgi:hypothetical protein
VSTDGAELVYALMHATDRLGVLRAHLTATLSTARVRQAYSLDPDAWVEVIGLLQMALEDDDRAMANQAEAG